MYHEDDLSKKAKKKIENLKIKVIVKPCLRSFFEYSVQGDALKIAKICDKSEKKQLEIWHPWPNDTSKKKV